jgi:hypothetical protein
MTIGLTLPRSDELTAAMLEVPARPLEPEELEQLRSHLSSSTSGLEPRRRGPARLDPASLTVDDHTLLRFVVNHEAEGLFERGDFVYCTAVTRAAIGRAGLHRFVSKGRRLSPAEAVSQVLADPVEDAWWGGWYASLDSSAQALVEAAAVAWVTPVWAALAWERIPRALVQQSNDFHDVSKSPSISLKSHLDVVVLVQATTAGGKELYPRRSALVVRSGAPSGGWKVELAFPALVVGLRRGPMVMPGRIVGLWPECGQARVLDVDLDVLSECADAVADLVAKWAAWRRQGPSPTPY